MNRGSGTGVGSASIVLIFAVLCLTVFSLIAFVVASNSKSITDSEAKLVIGYYEADALAERIVAEILESPYSIPEKILGIDVETSWDWQTETETVRFLCPVTDSGKSLYVNLAMRYGTCEILSWRMWDEGEWAADEGLNVWVPDEGLDVWLGIELNQ